MGPLIIAALLGLACALLVLQPLFGLDHTARDEQAQAPVALAEVAERERLAKQALLEVDFDHRLGNLGDADYAALKSRYERRALAALKARFERERSLDEVIERQLEAMRRQNAQGKKAGKAKPTTRQDERPAFDGAEGAAVASADVVNLADTTDAADSAPVTAATAAPRSGASVSLARASANGHTPHTTSTTRDRSPRRRKGV